MTALIFHIPHASTVIPPDAGHTASADYVAEQVRVMTDHHTDRLYGALAQDGDAAVVAPVSRLVVDVERFPDDAQEPMAARGMGAVYRCGHDGGELRSSLSMRDALMQRYYHPHHAVLEATVQDHLRRSGRAIILDCHSFAEHARPYERDHAEVRPEICIGTDSFHTPPGVADVMEDAYRAHGYSVARNTPFSGALVPLSAYGKDKRVASVMIELRRDIYMNEATSALNADISRVMAATGDAVAALRRSFQSA